MTVKVTAKPQQPLSPKATYAGGSTPPSPAKQGGVNSRPPKVKNVSTCTTLGAKPQRPVSANQR